MYGPKPPAARRLAHPLADGGLVARMKSADAGPAAFGSRGLSQLRDLIPKMEAMGYKQQPQSFAKGGMIRGPGTDTSDSIPDEMAPGTYILPADTTEKLALDDKKVPVRVSNGEYELPPEQVQAVGAAVLDAIKGVTHTPKSLSARGLKSANGEEQAFSGGGPVRREEGGGLSKEAVMAAIAKQASQQQPAQPAPAQQQPAARGIAGLATDFLRNPGGILAQRERQAGGYADGGMVDEEQQRLANQTAMYVQGAQAAAAAAPATPAAPVPAAPAPVASTPTEAKDPQDGAAAPRGLLAAAGQELPEWSRGQMSYGDQMRNLGQALLNVPKHIVSAPGYGFNQDAPAAKLAAAQTGQLSLPGGVAPSTAGAGRGSINPPLANPSAAAPESPRPLGAPSPAADTAQAPTPSQRMPGVYEHGRGQYSDNAAGMGMPANFTGQPNAQNMAAGESLAARSRQASMAQQSTGFQPQGVTAPTVLNSSNSWQARNDLRNLEVSAKSITNNGGRFDPTKGRNPAQAAYLSALQADAAARGAQPGLDAVAMRENAGIQREGMQQTGETARTGMREQGANARESGRSILARDEFNLRKEASGFQTRAAQQQEQLRNVILDPKATPAQKRQAQESLRALGGKAEDNRFTVVPGGQEWDATAGAMRNVPARVLNNQTGQFVEQGGAQQGGASQPLANHVAALKANPKQAAQFDDIYGPGAAALALGR